jgi:hypothetical protein
MQYNNETARFCILIDYRGRHRKGVAIYDGGKINDDSRSEINDCK